jgi:ABC-2 type transport system ATP-binding protein
MSARVSLKSVSRKFGQTTVLKGVDLEVAAGELVALIGPNGGGKSTLLMMMAGLLSPTSGTVTVCGLPAQRLALESAGKVGLVLARPGLYPLLTGWENLNYFGGLFGLEADDVVKKANAHLESVDLLKHMDKRVEGWSTGMQQKLSLVRALLLEPEVLLFDEPAANLDPLAAMTMYEELRSRADAGLACVLVTHDLEAAENFCNRIFLIQGGIKAELKGEGKPDQDSSRLLDAWKKGMA